MKRPVVLRLSINTTGQLEKATDVEEAIRCAVKNYGLVPRELLQQAWVKTGYATWEELCSLDEAAAGQEEAGAPRATGRSSWFQRYFGAGCSRRTCAR